MKALVVVLLGLLCFDPPMRGGEVAQRLGGGVLALGSAAAYSLAKAEAAKQAKAAKSPKAPKSPKTMSKAEFVALRSVSNFRWNLAAEARERAFVSPLCFSFVLEKSFSLFFVS